MYGVHQQHRKTPYNDIYHFSTGTSVIKKLGPFTRFDLKWGQFGVFAVTTST